MNKIDIQTHTGGPYATNCYLLTCLETKNSIVIDPVYQSEKKISGIISAHASNLVGIWLTHSHWDHIADCHAFRKKYGEEIPIFLHFLDKDNLIDPGSDGLFCPIPIVPTTPTTLFRDAYTLECGKSLFHVIHTPGHSPGSCCFFSSEERILFSGDTLFKGTYGNTSFPHSSADEMLSSLQTLAALPEETHVYPGHGDSTSIRHEKKWIVNRR